MNSISTSRRVFVKAAVAGMVSLWSRLAFPAASPAEVAPEGRLSLFNIHTAERLAIAYRDCEGRYDPDALEAIDRLMRCHYANEVAAIDTRVIDFLSAVVGNLGGGREIHVVSGYRSRAYNDLLVREGRGVVTNSLHLAGKAIDFRIPGIVLSDVKRTALAMKAGGVGFYPSSDFVHIDCGRIRSW